MPGRKIHIALIILALFGVVTGAFLYRSLKSEKNNVERQAQQMLDRKGEFNAQTTEAQVAELKEALLFLAQEVGEVKNAESESNNESSSFSRVSSPNLSGSINSGSADLLIRIRALEDKVSSLEQKIGVSSSPNPSSSSTITKLPVQYIPLGINAQTDDQNGVSLNTFEITLDPADFPNYTSMQLEVVMKLNEAIGTLTTSLYNYTDKSSIQYSETSTSSTNYVTGISSTFKLPSGRKTYRVWAKSSNGTLSQIQSARLKVNY